MRKIPKYGIPWRNIKCRQDQAKNLYRYNGIYAGRQFLEALSYGALASGREIGHAAIQLATHASPEHLKAVLSGTRYRR